MYCNKCGKQIPDDSTFCPHCGNKLETIAQEETASIKSGVAIDEMTPARKKAITTTLLCGLYGILFILLVLLFGVGIHLIIMAIVFMVLMTINTASYKSVEVGQKDIDGFTNHYREKIKGFDEKPEGYKARFKFNSPNEVTGFNRINVFLINSNKKGLGILATFAYIFAVFGLVFGIASAISGFNGFGLNLDGVYVQTGSYGSQQVGKTAYKIEGDNIYFAGYYDGSNTVWGGPYNYYRFGSKVTYTFSGGGMQSTHTFYFTNFGNNISSDRFGLSVEFKKVG